MRERSSGILMHISSLPGDYGIGDFGPGAYDFVDFLAKAGQKHWQLLPLGVTGYGDSPYQCFSAFAGNPYFIDLAEFIREGYLAPEDIQQFNLGSDSSRVDYGLLYNNKMKLLRLAYAKALDRLADQLEDFYQQHNSWLKEFALFMAIKAKYGNKSWLQWAEEHRKANSLAVAEFARQNREEVYFWVFTQYFFFRQWLKLKDYANTKGIRIIGDLPMYVAEDSADIWAKPSVFNVDANLRPVTVSGCPPDAFSKTGQLWGNPTYNWDAMAAEGYRWWLDRIRHSFMLFDSLRIDHFRGFESYWEVKYGSKTAERGRWAKGPGIGLFNKVKKELGELDIIAEDLGFITDDVRRLIGQSGFPGMKVLQFAFDAREESDYLPHNYPSNCVVYTGTHDNHTVLGWFAAIPPVDRDYAVKYFNLTPAEGYNWGFIRGAWSSVAYLAMAPMQDFLGLGDEARLNIPSTIGGNWAWRLNKDCLTDELAEKIRAMTRMYGREGR